MMLQLAATGPRAASAAAPRLCVAASRASARRPLLKAPTGPRTTAAGRLVRDLATLAVARRSGDQAGVSGPARQPPGLPNQPPRWFSLSAARPRTQEPTPPPPPPRRESPLRKVLPGAAHENIYTLPNLLTASRLVAAPFIGYCILHDHHAWALGLFAYAGITDLLDGWIARRWGLGTVVGTVIDPMADKTLMTVLTVALAVKGALPVWLAAIILGRDVGLGIAAIYYRWISLPPPKTFARYWDFSLPSAEVHPTTISKYNTALQMGLMGLTTLAPVVPIELALPLTAMQYVVAVTTVWSGASYIYSKDAVKILSEAERREKEEKREER